MYKYMALSFYEKTKLLREAITNYLKNDDNDDILNINILHKYVTEAKDAGHDTRNLDECIFGAFRPLKDVALKKKNIQDMLWYEIIPFMSHIYKNRITELKNGIVWQKMQTYPSPGFTIYT